MRNTNDVITEKILDEVLTTPPDILLPDNFADVVAQKMQKRFIWREYIIEFAAYFGAFVGLVLVAAGIAFFWYGANWNEWLNFISANVWTVAGANFLLLFILFTDRVLLPYFLFWSRLKATS